MLFFFTLGVMLDISATILMILGSTKGLLTFHGVLGYSALSGMVIDAFLLWKHNLKKGSEEKGNNNLNLYSRIAYGWWVLAFITGGLLVAGQSYEMSMNRRSLKQMSQCSSTPIKNGGNSMNRIGFSSF